MKNNAYNTTLSKSSVFVTTLKAIALVMVFFVATTTFAQETESSEVNVSESQPSEITEALDISTSEEPLTPEFSISEPTQEPELTREQRRALRRLDRQLARGRITQEEYDTQRNEILGITPDPIEEPELELQAASLSSFAITTEPESQSLGKYVAPQVSTQNGSLNYSYNLVTPPGRNGLTPNLSLNYNSNNTSPSSIIATGWSFDIPYIQRLNKTGTDNLYTTDTFTSSLDGELIDQGNGVYTPRVETGSFLKYEYSNNTWTVTDKTGTIYEFGTTAQAQQNNPDDTPQIYSWMLEKVTDTNGNEINYTYYKDQGQIYPDTISYTDDFFEITFNRTNRTTTHTDYTPGFEVTTNYFINEVQVQVDNEETIEYQFIIEDGLLKDIEVKSIETEVVIDPPAPEPYLQASGMQLPVDASGNVVMVHYEQNLDYGSKLIDVNGDGLPDIVNWYKGQPNSYTGGSYTGNEVYINNGSTWVADPNFLLPTDTNGNVITISYERSNRYGTTFADVNADGLQDILTWYKGQDNNHPQNEVYLNNGSTWVADPSFLLPTDANGKVITVAHTTSNSSGSLVIDLNADGKDDILSWRRGYNNTNVLNEVYLNNGSTWVADPNFLLPTDANGNVVTMYYDRSRSSGSQMVDLNGDNLPDLLRWVYGQNNSHPNNQVYINTGSGWQEDTSYILPTDPTGKVLMIHTSSRDDYGAVLTDVNGDQLLDVINWVQGEAQGYTNSYKRNEIYLNTGNKTWQRDDTILLPTDTNGDVISMHYTTDRDDGGIVIDVDNDGLSDLLSWKRSHTNNHQDNEVYLNTFDTQGQEEAIEIPEFDLPPVELEYYQDYGTTWSPDSNTYTLPEELGSTSADLGVRILDINGDGFVDVVRSYDPSGGGLSDRIDKMYFNNGDHTWTEDTTWQWSDIYHPLSSATQGAAGYEFADVNGDSLTDLVLAEQINSQRRAGVFINTGSGWQEDNSWLLGLPNDFTFKRYYSGRYYDTGGRILDINGDGLPDLVESYNYNGDHRTRAFLNTGTGWSETTLFQAPEPFSNSIGDGRGTDLGVRFQDINGDGLPDLIRAADDLTASDDINKVYLNTGAGWELSTHTLPVYITKEFSGEGYKDTGVRFGELNGDGLVDFAVAGNHSGQSRGIYLNTGTDWELTPGFPNLYFTDIYNVQDKRELLDINADGLADIVTADDGNTVVWENIYEAHERLSSLTNHQGGESTFDYATSHELHDEHNFSPVQVVATITTNDQQGNQGTTSYQYQGADFYYGGPQDKKFAGFTEVIQTNPDGSVQTTLYHQGNGEQGNEPTDSYSKIGRVYEQVLEDANGNLYSRSRTNYTENNLGGESNSILTSSQLSQQFDGTTTSTDTASSYIYDNYGNVTTETMHGEVTGNPDGTWSDTGSDTRTSEYTYTNDTANYIVGLPTNQTLKNHNGDKEAESIFTYDSDGNLTTESHWIEGNNYADTTYTYNSKGLVTSETDPLGNTTFYAYSSELLYPDEVTNAENHETTYQWDYSSGKPTEVVEPNGKVTQYTYDGLDRLLEVKETIENGDPETVRTISYHTQSTPQYSKETIVRGNTPNQEIYSYVDGFGRTIQVKSEAENYWVTLDTVYDEMGRVDQQSLPYETTSKSNSSTTNNNDLLTNFTYDALGRVISTGNAKGTTTTSYDGFKTTITDAENNQKDLVTDAYGNLVQVNEYNGGSVYETEYQYNTQNLLTKITDAENNVRNIDYDGLGRRTSLEDLHAQGDSTHGTWTFVYNDLNLTSQTDPRGTTTSYTYDDINRVLTENNDSTTGTDITYSYDSCLHGDGMLCSVTTPEVTTTYTYQKQGLTESETKTIDSVDYTTSYDYNKQGDVTKVTHPNGSATEYGYNTRGLVNEVKLTGQSLVTAEYGVHGRPTSYTHSNGVTSTFSYDPTELYELTNKTTTNGTTDFQKLSYSYDDVGNITQIVDSSDTDTAKTQSFTYDDLYRLTGTTVTNASNGQNYLRSYSYSPIGNITSFNGTSFSYSSNGYANPHAVTSVGGQSYSYDNNGNLTSDGTWNHTWNYDNTLASSSNGSTTSSYEYDHTNQRIKLVEGSDTTIYPTTSYQVHNGTPKIDVNLGDTLVATEEAGTINHVHTDHLGGTNITTDSTGVITQTLDYYPYGDTRVDTGTNDETKQFTGYVKDESTGLNYAGARYHDSSIGRFISQDPVALSLGDVQSLTEKTNTTYRNYLSNPQGHNSYSYAVNNPIKYVDKNGEFVFDVLEGLFTPAVAYAPSNDVDIESLPPGDPFAGSEAITNIGLLLIPGPAGLLKHTDEAVDVAKNIDNVPSSSDEFAQWLNRGETNTSVYNGVKDGEDVYVGITKNLDNRAAQHGDRFDNIQDISQGETFTRNQARSIEQAAINNNPDFTNRINSISPERSWYDRAVDWGQRQLDRITRRSDGD